MPNLPNIMKRINYLHILHRLSVQQDISDSGLHFGQPPILEYIAAHEDCTQRELCDFLCISPPSAATSVKRLQRAGFLEKCADEHDLRRTHLRITDAGRAAMHFCKASFDRVDEKLMRGFSPEELQLFCDYLSRMIDNLADGDLKNASVFALLEKAKEMQVQTVKEDRRDPERV